MSVMGPTILIWPQSSEFGKINSCDGWLLKKWIRLQRKVIAGRLHHLLLCCSRVLPELHGGGEEFLHHVRISGSDWSPWRQARRVRCKCTEMKLVMKLIGAHFLHSNCSVQSDLDRDTMYNHEGFSSIVFTLLFYSHLWSPNYNCVL